jgi:hypothetical protein
MLVAAIQGYLHRHRLQDGSITPPSGRLLNFKAVPSLEVEDQ